MEMSIKATDMIAIEKKKALKRSMLLEDALLWKFHLILNLVSRKTDDDG